MRAPEAGRSFLRDLVLLVGAMILSTAPAAAQQTVTIDVFNYDFGNAMTGQPIDPTITVGDTVRWVWVDPFHSTTSMMGQAESWDSGVLDPPSTFSHTFTTVGTYDYFCSFHGASSCRARSSFSRSRNRISSC